MEKDKKPETQSRREGTSNSLIEAKPLSMSLRRLSSIASSFEETNDYQNIVTMGDIANKILKEKKKKKP